MYSADRSIGLHTVVDVRRDNVNRNFLCIVEQRHLSSAFQFDLNFTVSLPARRVVSGRTLVASHVLLLPYRKRDVIKRVIVVDRDSAFPKGNTPMVIGLY